MTDLGKSTRATVAPKLDAGTSGPTPASLRGDPVGDHGDIAMKAGGLPVATMSDEGVVATSLIGCDEVLEANLKVPRC